MIQPPENKSLQGDKHHLAAIVFADIVGSTATMERDEKLALENLQRMREAAYPLVEEHTGKVIKELGDGFLAVFNSAVKATSCSLNIQKSLQATKGPQLRISIHIGDVVVEKGDVFGSGVNIASRMNSHALPGGIAVSGDVWRQLQNKADYTVRSLGFKELKGVGEPFEVFELLEAAQTTGKRAPFVQSFKRSRIPHFLVSYLVGSWTFVYFTTWFVNRYLLSPHIIDFIFTALATLAPTAVLVGYARTQPGAKAGRFKKLGIPLNLALSGFLLFGLFRDKDLGSIMANVTLVNEQGQTIQRTIPKGEFRKKIFIFPFENASGDTSYDWLMSGISQLLIDDIDQGSLVDFTQSNLEEHEKLGLRNWNDLAKLPLSSKLKFSEKSHTTHFIYGNYTIQNNLYIIQVALNNTRNGENLSHKTFKGNNLFKLVDEISTQLKFDLKISPGLIEKTKDLPVAEITTNSLPALKMYHLSIEMFWDQKQVYYLEQAIREDSTFTEAYRMLAWCYYFSGKKEKAKEELKEGMKFMYGKSEDQQLSIKLAYYHIVEDNPEKRIALLKMQSELNPDDVDNLRKLAFEYSNNAGYKEAISMYYRILKLTPEEYYTYFEIGLENQKMGRPKEAIKYFKLYAEKYPDEYTPYLNIAQSYENIGDDKKAKEYYEKVLLLYPDQTQSLLFLAKQDEKSGNYKKALKQYEEALRRCHAYFDSTQSYSALIELLEMMGQAKEATHFLPADFDCIDRQKRGYPDKPVRKLSFLHYYIRAGERDEAFRKADSLKNELKKEDEIEFYLTRLWLYYQLQDTSHMEMDISTAESLKVLLPQSKNIPNCEFRIEEGKAALSELKGQNEEAITLYQKAWGKSSSDDGSPPDIFLARCLRKSGKTKKAEELLLRGLKRWPFIPKANYELALVYADMGKKDKSIEHLNKALQVWAEADTDYIPAKKAREKLAELQSKP